MYVEEKRTSSGVAKAGLVTGIAGATLGVHQIPDDTWKKWQEFEFKLHQVFHR